MKTGKSLEKLIYHLEKMVADNNNVLIESPRRIRDKITGQFREHDVVLTIKQHHHELQLAIECRDRSRPVTVNQVESFWTKLQHTGIDQGVIVSPKGFYKTARKKADHLGIRCLDLEQVESFKWLLTPDVREYQRNVKHIHWKLIPKDNLKEKISNFSVVNSEGVQITTKILNANAKREFDRLLPEPDEVGTRKIKIGFEGNEFFLRDDNTGELFPLKQLIVTIEYEVVSKHLPLSLLKYADKKTGTDIIDLALAELDFGQVTGNLVIAYKANEGGQVFFLPHEQNQK